MNKSQTVIYVLEHFGGLSHLLTLRLLKHRDERAILAVVSAEQKKYFLTKLICNNLFDYVLEYQNCGLQEASEQKTIEALSTEYDELLGKHGIDIERIRLGYVFYDVFACFSLYLHNRNIDIITVEIEPDYIWRYHHRFVSAIKILLASSTYYDCVSKILPTDSNREVIKKVLVYPETEVKDNDFVERYDFNANFLKVSEDDKRKILHCFSNDLERMDDDGISLLLPSSIGWLNFITALYTPQANVAQFFYNQHKYDLLFAVICDYFYDRQYQLIVHSHPAKKIDHKIFQKDCLIRIDDEMPIEFLLYVPGLKIQEVLAIETSSTDKMKSMIKTDRSLGRSFISAFHYMDKLYVVQKMVNMYIENNTVFCYGIPDKTCTSLYNCNFDDHDKRQFIKIYKLQPFDGANCYIINSSWLEHEPITNNALLLKTLEEASEESVVFFINSLQEYCFTDLNNLSLLAHITPLIIRRKPLRDSPLCETYDQVVYVFSKSKRIHEALKTVSFTKQMLFSGVEIVVSPVTTVQAETEHRKCIDFSVGVAAKQSILSSWDKQVDIPQDVKKEFKLV